MTDTDRDPVERRKVSLPEVPFEQDQEAIFGEGVTYGIQIVAESLGIHPDEFSWDAATEEFEGDARAIVGNMLSVITEDYLELRALLAAKEAAEAERDQFRLAGQNFRRGKHTADGNTARAEARAEAAEAEAAALKLDHGRTREQVCALADYILNREGGGLTKDEASGLFADLQRLRLRMDKALATIDQPKEGDEDE